MVGILTPLNFFYDRYSSHATHATSPMPNPSTTGGPGPNPGCDCDGAMFDKRCSDPANDPYGGLGCMACGKNDCRYCGHDNLPQCEGTNIIIFV